MTHNDLIPECSIAVFRTEKHNAEYCAKNSNRHRKMEVIFINTVIVFR